MSNWYSYDWELLGHPAAFHVDLAYQEEFDTLGDFTTLLYVSCFSLLPGAQAFTARQKRQLDGVLRDCLKVLAGKAVYVGFIDVEAQRRYYFYTSDARLLVPLMHVGQEQGDFRVESVKAAEPNRQTYYRLLAPDAAKRQANDNLRYIASLRARGDDTAALRRVNLHFFLPTVQGRTLFARDAKNLGFAIGADDYIAERELPYYLALHRISALETRALTRLTTDAIAAAEAYGGVMDHLDSAFVPKRGWLK